MADCLFCAIVAGEAPAQIVDSDEHTVAFMDINPATAGHALVIPRRHSADLLEISDSDLEHTMVAARRLAAQPQPHGLVVRPFDPRAHVVDVCGPLQA